MEDCINYGDCSLSMYCDAFCKHFKTRFRGKMDIVLNKTKRHSYRFRLVNGSMGSSGDPKHYPTHDFEVASGVDRGNGYQGYYSITYVLTEIEWFPSPARFNLIMVLTRLGYERYLKEIGVL